MIGNDIVKDTSYHSFHECASKCIENINCTHFAWSSITDGFATKGTCWLKSLASAKLANATPSSIAWCGVVLSR
jgi:hypothetical protein